MADEIAYIPPRVSGVDVSMMESFSTYKHDFPKVRGLWLYGSIEAGLTHLDEELRRPENVSSA